jgi:hypothetical protein
MTDRHCLRHKDRPAIGNCYQCHKPMCAECRYAPTLSEGLFCSQACYDQYLAYQSRKRPALKPSRLKRLVVAAVLLALLAAAVLVGGAKGIPILKSIRQAILGSGR